MTYTNLGACSAGQASGTTTQKTINVTGSSNKAHIGIKDLLITDTALATDSGTSGYYNKVALNYAYDSVTKRLPAFFRAYGGTTDLADWTIKSDVNSVTVTKTGGSGECCLEIIDLFLVASLLEFNLGGTMALGDNTYIECEVLTPSSSLMDTIYVIIGTRGENISGGFGGSFKDFSVGIVGAGGGVYNINNGAVNNNYISSAFRIELRIGNPVNETVFTTRTQGTFDGSYLSQLGTFLTKSYSSHENKGLYISMQGNYSIKFNMRGWIGD